MQFISSFMPENFFRIAAALCALLAFNLPLQAQPTSQAAYTPFYEGREFVDTEYGQACSMYCLLSPDTIYATSELAAGAAGDYRPRNLFDFDTTTAWADGARGPGKGEAIVFGFDLSKFDTTVNAAITTLELFNGYYKSEKLWRANGRVKTMDLYVDGRLHCRVNWLDKRDLQSAEIPPIPLPGAAARLTLRFVITDVYPGERYDDVCITELGYGGVGHH